MSTVLFVWFVWSSASAFGTFSNFKNIFLFTHETEKHLQAFFSARITKNTSEGASQLPKTRPKMLLSFMCKHEKCF